MGTRQQFSTGTPATARVCAMRIPRMCHNMSNGAKSECQHDARSPGWLRRQRARVEQDRWVLANSFQPVRRPPHACARCACRECATICRTVPNPSVSTTHARPGGCGIRARVSSRTNGYLPTVCNRYGGHRTRVRDAHADNVPKYVERCGIRVSARCTLARVAAASARAGLAEPMGTRQQLATATAATAPVCAMRMPIMCQNMSNGAKSERPHDARSPG